MGLIACSLFSKAVALLPEDTCEGPFVCLFDACQCISVYRRYIIAALKVYNHRVWGAGMRGFANISAMMFLVFLAPVMFPGSGSGNAQAQSLAGMSCHDLWYERNRIYAARGYCFKTSRAINVFGRGCFAPYGRLSGAEQRRVGAIRGQERYMGCASGGQNTYAPPPPVPQASAYAGMSCNQLWYERNSIFARNGHCFKSARGRAAFGAGCFAPYGRLGRAEQNIVDEIRRWERRLGCR